MSSIAVSAFATLGRTCLIPNAHGHRFGHRGHPRLIRSNPAFHVCHLNRQHMASIAVGLGIITLLLIIFAYHGGYGIGSWFYSLLVVVSGLAFVVFGPLLLCRFLMHAYCRHVEARTIRLQADNANQTNSAVEPGRPHVYACIIIAPEEITGSFGATSNLSNLPTYEEAILQTNAHGRMNDNTFNSCSGGLTKMNSQSKTTILFCADNNDENFPKSQRTSTATTTTTKQFYNANCLSNETVRDDSPPPSYVEALFIIAQNQSQPNLQIDATTENTSINIEEELSINENNSSNC